ncbi:RNA polymerase sigma-54 factor [alpha proteobacterium AAP81b]|nr:RNA polymerase sigma-54 factor [alpha proteobacterium AAP81b]
MGIGPRLELRQSQQLVMTPQLQLAIKLLTLTNIELETYIGEELDKNPLLTSGEAEPDIAGGNPDPGEPPAALPDATTGRLDELLGAPASESPLDIDASADAPAPGADAADWSVRHGEAGEAIDFDSFALPERSLAEVLDEQAGAAFAGADLIIARHIIDLLDDAGYLGEPLDDIADRLGAALADVERVLARLQTFDPCGVAARSLAECIAIQARDADRYDPAMAALIDNLELVARGDIAMLMRRCGVDREDIVDMIRELRRYNPKPGLQYGGERPSPVVADVFVTQGPDGEWRIELNQATLPRLIIDRDYQSVLEKGASKATTSFLGDCVQSANWLLKALDQRARTIVKVSTELVRHQQGFFENGVSALRPLTLRTIADAIEMHESTVSRVTSNKYLQCERGLFELRYFFTSGVASGDGGEAASALAVKDRIARLIAAEGADVLSDDKLVEILRGEGFDLARRTVAKYREALGLGSSVARRRAKLLAA